MKFHSFIVVCLALTINLSILVNCLYCPDVTSTGGWQWRGGTSAAYIPGSSPNKPFYVSNTSPIPSPRHSSAVWHPSFNQTFIFGGMGPPQYNPALYNGTAPTSPKTDGLLNDLWVFSATDNTWILKSFLYEGHINAVGIYPNVGAKDDSSEHDFLEHTQTSKKAKKSASSVLWPGSRKQVATWVSPIDNTLWMFGGMGFGQDNSSIGYLSDLWQYNPSSAEWVFIGGPKTLNVLETSSWPASRAGSITWTTPGYLWLFAGYGPYMSSSGLAFLPRNDLWRYNLSTGVWTLIGGKTTVSNANPFYIAPRSDSVFLNDENGLIWIFGGYGAASVDTFEGTLGYLNDLWVWNITAEVWHIVSPLISLNAPGFISESSGVPSPNNYPPARCCGAAWLDSYGAVYIFGGFGFTSELNFPSQSPQYISDLWVLEPGTNFRDRSWIWVYGGESIQTSTQPPVWGAVDLFDAAIMPGSRAWMTSWFDEISGSIWMFGAVGVSPRTGATSPAYFQDIWSFALPPPPLPPIKKSKLSKSQIVLMIVWIIVALEMVLLALFLTILYKRRRNTILARFIKFKPKPTLSKDEPNPQKFVNELELKPINEQSSTQVTSSNHTHSKSPKSSHSSKPNSASNSNSSYPDSIKDEKSVAAVIVSTSPPIRKTRKGKSPSPHSTKSTDQTSEPQSGSLKSQFSDKSPITANFEFGIKKKELEFGNIIGRGSSGIIYAGKWHGQRVAIKQLATEVLVGEREGALQEARLVSHLRPHSNVIQIFGICVTKENVFIVMNKMHSSLDKVIYHVHRRAWLTVPRIYKIALGIVAGMIHLESQNICHRDLSARNVCLSKAGNPCITDFGMSRKLNYTASAGETDTQMGPVAWMAPECFHQKYSSKSDVWSFGILLYEMLTYTVPHRGADLYELAIQIRDKGITPGPIPDNCDPGLVKIMKLCWRFDPNHRPTFSEISQMLQQNSPCSLEESESAQDEVISTSNHQNSGSTGKNSSSSSGSSRTFVNTVSPANTQRPNATGPPTPPPTTATPSLAKQGGYVTRF